MDCTRDAESLHWQVGKTGNNTVSQPYLRRDLTRAGCVDVQHRRARRVELDGDGALIHSRGVGANRERILPIDNVDLQQPRYLHKMVVCEIT